LNKEGGVMKIFFDTEFTGLHQGTTLISIAFVSEDDKTFYAEFTDYDKNQVNNWIRDSVISRLKYPDSISYSDIVGKEGDIKSMDIVGNHEEIQFYLITWLNQFETIELVADVCYYDMVLFCELFGGSNELPKNISPTCRNLNQDIATHYGISVEEAFKMSREEIIYSFHPEFDLVLEEKHPGLEKHNSLCDAVVTKYIYEAIN
jgi:hypothetical protein